MRQLSTTAAVLGVLGALAAVAAVTVPRGAHPPVPGARPQVVTEPVSSLAARNNESAIPAEALTAVVRRLCGACHNEAVNAGNLHLTAFDVGAAPKMAETAEKMIVKLRSGMMPPPGIPRPGGDTLRVLVETLEQLIDGATGTAMNPGNRPFQRLNRAEYERSISQLLALDINAGDYLPLDTKSANFDNIADVQMLSPTLLGAYLNAADQISRLAVGDRNVAPSSKTYEKPGYFSQWDHEQGAPFGTRGGITVMHNFPADGEYVFRMAFDHTTTGGYYGSTIRFEQIEISIDGERAALLDMDQWMHVQDRNGVNMDSEPIRVQAGPHRVSAAFIRRTEGPMEDLVSPHEWSLADRQIGAGGYGITSPPHLKELVVAGPHHVTGVSETPSRNKIFTCRPTSAQQYEACAQQILTRLAAQAYRRPLTAEDAGALLKFYRQGVAAGDFETGVRTGLQAILASPDFVFRYEPARSGSVKPGETYRISDLALAARLSFFLWGAPPDEELMALARGQKLSGPVLEAQVRRMLKDARAEALGTRFAAQWLRLQDLDKVHPDAFWFPDFDQQLADAMRRETELFFYNLVRDDRSLLELFRADYTFVNERLARHYGMANVVGTQFRKVSYPDASRRGLFGQGSILTLTSHANRTSPVLRGKWVMEVLLGTPPPPPPPGVPDLEETADETEGRLLTTRERMEQHRSNPTCRSCHQYMDPIGLALDNFDVTGKWRIRENGMALDTRGELYDGTPVSNPDELRKALLKRPIPLVRTFTENLMAYALGRRVEYYDKPAIRIIAKEAEANDYRMSAFILGVVKSAAFQYKREGVADEPGRQGNGQKRSADNR
ncbi:MAG: DUF1592 domain-containing protein [Longimicrobiales bacterium]